MNFRLLLIAFIITFSTIASGAESHPCETEKEGRMPKTSINYLFPPNKINELPTWRFVLHFKAPTLLREKKIRKVREQLKAASFKAVTFPFGLDKISHNQKNDTVGIPIEVPEARRKQQGSLADYESDVWKIYGNMVECGFGDLYYEAIDWRE